MDFLEHLRLHRCDVRLVHSGAEFDISLDLGFGIVMNTRLVLPVDVDPLSSNDPVVRESGRAAHRFATDWVADDPTRILCQVVTEVGDWIVGDLFTTDGDSLTFDLLNVGLAESPVRVS